MVTRRRVKVHSDATNPGVGTIAVGDRIEVEVTAVEHRRVVAQTSPEFTPVTLISIKIPKLGPHIGVLRINGEVTIEVDR